MPRFDLLHCPQKLIRPDIILNSARINTVKILLVVVGFSPFQDCQIFFIRPSQLPLLSTMNVNIHNSYCFSNLVQLHLKSHNSLLLLTKQAGNRMCTLDVQIPPTEMLFGDHLFR
ncbi:unnamed protein product [Angiostrongylus costaricensis]|uniref:Ovule protein n=1 Tax=Angiostrongylus costaricensis TaxID=334426 RepID=A0A0R3PC16_ANGCS|nr:unnamed protein product [Angiostrongylus costaricensis]